MSLSTTPLAAPGPALFPPAAAAASASPTATPLTVRVPAFEGPLDLLLHLVRAGRMDIFDLPIATLCDQYMAHLAAMEALDLTIAGEFVVMAATLLEIKSRLLLPPPPREDGDADPEAEDEEGLDPRAQLVERLLEYGRYQKVADALKGCEGQRRQVFFRGASEYRGEYALPPRFGEMGAEALLRTLQRMLASVGAGERAVTSVRRQKITLRLKMREVLTRAEAGGAGGVALSDLLPVPPFALLEVVLLFLALLELLKAGSVVVAQESFCGDIRVFFVPAEARETLVGEAPEPGIVPEEERPNPQERDRGGQR